MYGGGLRLLRFFFLKRIITPAVFLREQLFQTVRRIAGKKFQLHTLLFCLRYVPPRDILY